MLIIHLEETHVKMSDVFENTHPYADTVGEGGKHRTAGRTGVGAVMIRQSLDVKLKYPTQQESLENLPNH